MQCCLLPNHFSVSSCASLYEMCRRPEEWREQAAVFQDQPESLLNLKTSCTYLNKYSWETQTNWFRFEVSGKDGVGVGVGVGWFWDNSRPRDWGSSPSEGKFKEWNISNDGNTDFYVKNDFITLIIETEGFLF